VRERCRRRFCSVAIEHKITRRKSLVGRKNAHVRQFVWLFSGDLIGKQTLFGEFMGSLAGDAFPS
jgi:hypothetical protein